MLMPVEFFTAADARADNRGTERTLILRVVVTVRDMLGAGSAAVTCRRWLGLSLPLVVCRCLVLACLVGRLVPADLLLPLCQSGR
jgi:hypothetical protein